MPRTLARTMRLLVAASITLAGSVTVGVPAAPVAAAPCDPPPTSNPIVCENSLAGDPSSAWDLPNQDMGDPSIQGFATEISVNKGQTVQFKINTPSTKYHIDIYRLGYYQGNGARKIATINPSASLP